MNPDEYCQQQAASSGSSFYYSFLFLPAEKRRAITALYAFCREVDDCVDECSDPGVARSKLAWWQDEIDRAFANTPQHPVSKALQPHLERYNLPREYFQEILDGMTMDLDKHRYADFSELALYCYRAAGVVGLLSAEIFGYQDRATLKYATDLGTALQLTNILRDVHEDAARGRIYLPLDEMQTHGVDPRSLLSHQSTPALQSLLAFQAKRAQDYFDRAFREIPRVDRYAQRSGLIMGNIYRSLLDEIARDGFNTMERHITLTPLRKLWIAWRTVRREKRQAR